MRPLLLITHIGFQAFMAQASDSAAINLTLLNFSAFSDDLIGQISALLVLTVAAAELTTGPALLVVYDIEPAPTLRTRTPTRPVAL